MSFQETFVLEGTSATRPPVAMTLWTTTPQYHNEKCSVREEGFGTTERACNTGLRVYEGARLLSEFLLSDVFQQSLLFRMLRNETEDGSDAVVELGCGCGLAGLTLHRVLCQAAAPSPSAPSSSSNTSIILTDASEECVGLVQRTIDEVVCSWTAPVSIVADTLWWSVDNAKSFLKQHHLPRCQLVLGSDLLYFMVDVDVLLSTCRALLEGEGPTPDAGTKEDHTAPAAGCVLLAHFMRIPDGQRKVSEAARARHGFHIAQVQSSRLFEHHHEAYANDEDPAKNVVDGAAVLRQRGWGSLELLLLMPRSTVRRKTEDPNSCAAEDDVIAIREATGIAPLLPYPLIRDVERNGEDEGCLPGFEEGLDFF